MNLDAAKVAFLEGITHFEAGRLAEARDSFEQALVFAPGRPSVLSNLGITLFHLGQWNSAGDTLRQAVAAEPGNADAWISLGLSEQRLEQWSSAAQALQRGLALDPRRFALWLVCAECWLRVDRADAALAAYDSALAADPRFAEAWSAKGNLLREMNKLDDAAWCYEQALTLGAEIELHRYYLASVKGGTVPAAPPASYVQSLFDDYARDFESHLVGKLGYRAHEVLVKPLLDRGRRFRRVLDLGCGTGLCCRQVKPVADEVDGVDLSAAMVEEARRTGAYRRLAHSDLAAFLEACSESYDLVLAGDVFIYVGDLAQVFRGVRRLLAEDGVFAFSVELAAGSGFRLLSSLRYAHSDGYVQRLASENGLVVTQRFEAPIRYDQRRPVNGYFYYLTCGTT